MTRTLVLSIAVMISSSGVAQSDPWAALRVLEGKWEGPVLGQPGKGISSREYRFELGGHFLSQRDRTVYEAKSPGAKPQIHEDLGFFSYDTSLKKFVWRQFHNEGFVNEYRSDSVTADGRSMEFVTTRIRTLRRAGERKNHIASLVLTNWTKRSGRRPLVRTWKSIPIRV